MKTCNNLKFFGKSHFLSLLITLALCSSLQAQQRDVLWIGGLQPSHTVFRASKDKFANDFQINTVLVGQNYFPEQGVDAAVAALNPLVNNSSNVLGVAHDYSGIILRKLQLENPNISAMILNGVPNQGSSVIGYATDNDGNPANLTNMEQLINKVNNIKQGDACEDCNIVGAFSSFMMELENLRDPLLYVTPDGQVKDLAQPTVPTAVLWGDAEMGATELFLASLMSSWSDPLPLSASNKYGLYGQCIIDRRLRAREAAKTEFQIALVSSTSNFFSNLLKAVGNFINFENPSPGNVVSFVGDWISINTAATVSQIEVERKKNDELARLLRCEMANQVLAARYITMLTNNTLTVGETQVPDPQAVMACYMDCLAQEEATSQYCNDLCDPQFIGQQTIPAMEFAPNDGLYTKEEQLLDGATVSIRLAGVNHFDEPKHLHPTVRQAYEDLFNGNAGPAFAIPPQ